LVTNKNHTGLKIISLKISKHLDYGELSTCRDVSKDEASLMKEIRKTIDNAEMRATFHRWF